MLAAISAGMHVVWVPEASEEPGIPGDSLTEEQKSRIIRLKSLEQFDPSYFGIAPY